MDEKTEQEQEEQKTAFQKRKENFYDGLNITVRQLDIFILLCLGVIVLLTLKAVLS